MAYIYDLSDQWAAAGTTFTAIKMNVNEIAASALSMLMDLQVGGVSRFSVRRDGLTTIRHGSFIDVVDVGIGVRAGSSGFIVLAGTTGGISFTPTNNAGSASEFSLLRDAANTLAQRSGVNAQAFNLYNTYTDASNFERGYMRWTSNILRIGTDELGTGTARALEFQTDGTTRMTIEATGAVNTAGSLIAGAASGITTAGYLGSWVSGRIGFSGTATLLPGTVLDTYISRSAGGILAITDAAELTEMVAPAAPAANKVRIYSEDNGSGKTRLMARFATGAAVQIAIEP